MLENHAKLLTVFQEAGEVIGRKKLQKILYILKKFDYPFEQKYQFHFYGPYSEELTLQVEELSNLGLIQEVKEEKGGYHQYRYTLTEEGGHFLSNYQIEMANVRDLLSRLNEENSRFLELVSTVLFFDSLEGHALESKIQTVKQKQNYTSDEIGAAVAYIDKINH